MGRFLVTKSDGNIRPVGTKSTIFKKLRLKGTSQAVVATVGAGARGTWRRIWFIFHLSASVNKRVATLLLFAVPRGLIGSSHWRKTLFFITPHRPFPPPPGREMDENRQRRSGFAKNIKPEALSSAGAATRSWRDTDPARNPSSSSTRSAA